MKIYELNKNDKFTAEVNELFTGTFLGMDGAFAKVLDSDGNLTHLHCSLDVKKIME